MRLCWLKIGIAAVAISLPLTAQNNPLFAPHTSTATPPGTAAGPGQASPNSAQTTVTPQATTKASPGKSARTEPSAAKRHDKSRKVEVAKAPELPPPPPPPPPTPEQMPANPPQVSYLNGQLTIQSTNATLSSILNAVRQQTGAQIDLPPGAGSERVATRVGPGPARDVIASLLSGSSFDFLILGSPNSPGGVQRIILTARSKAGATGSVNMAGMAQRPAPQPQAEENNPAEEEAEAPEPPEQEPPQPPMESAPVPQPGPGMTQPQAGGQPPATVAPQPGSPIVPGPTPEQQPPQASSPDQQGNTGPQVKTPEQMLQELQKLAPKQQ
jgi:hypothetical protein